MQTRTRLTAAALAAAVTVGLWAAPASAHVGTSVDSVAAGSSTALGLTIGHGCEGSPTTGVAVQVPSSIVNATAFAKPGWTVTSEREALATPVSSAHGEPATERVSVIRFTAEPGNALPNDLRDTFSINFTAPDTPGETLFFKTVQTCEAGEHPWIDEWDGEGEEPESPAPSLLVTEAEADGGHGTADGSDGEEEAASDEAAANDDGEATDTTELAADLTTTAAEGDGDGTALAVVGIVVGALGPVVGGVAFAQGRRRR